MANTYWVEFSYKYEWYDDDSQSWEEEKDSDAKRFCCLKKDIRKEIKKWIEDNLKYEQVRKLTFKITDCYVTTFDEN